METFYLTDISNPVIINTRKELDIFMREKRQGVCTIKTNVRLYKDSKLSDVVFEWNGDLLFGFCDGEYPFIVDWSPVYNKFNQYKKENLINDYHSTWFWRIKDFSINGCMSFDKVNYPLPEGSGLLLNGLPD